VQFRGGKEIAPFRFFVELIPDFEKRWKRCKDSNSKPESTGRFVDKNIEDVYIAHVTRLTDMSPIFFTTASPPFLPLPTLLSHDTGTIPLIVQPLVHRPR
jgi:hypothetical protein